MKKTSTQTSLQPTGKKAAQASTTRARRTTGNPSKSTTSNSTETRYQCNERGLFWHDGENWKRLCSPLDTLAYARTDKSENWSLLVRFQTLDNEPVEMVLARSDLSANDGGTGVIKALLDKGLDMEGGRKVKPRLVEYLACAKPDKRVRLVNRFGWHGNAFLLPTAVLGDTPESLHYHTDKAASIALSEAGTLQEWQGGIAAFAKDNDLLAFAISAAFAAPLLDVLGVETCGFHFVGDSSLGKSTLLKLAASVCGSPSNYPYSWRATDNALEGVAAAHSDGLLILDEIGECDPRIIGETVYMLGNGHGKARANDKGSTSGVQHKWRLVWLSSGEKTLAAHMAEAGKSFKAGMEMRLLMVPLDLHEDEATRKQQGIFQTLHGYAHGAALSDHLNSVAASQYGTALPVFLTKLVQARQAQDKSASLAQRLRTMQQAFANGCLTENAAGQARRAAAKFALVAAAGELATEWGVTGWEQGWAWQAAQFCFRLWLNQRGGEGSHEEKEMLEQVRSLLDKYGESRFTRWDKEGSAKIDEHQPRTMERWGFKRTEENPNMLEGVSTNTVYYVLPDVFKRELCKGQDAKRVARLLAQHGALKTDGTSLQGKARLPGYGNNQKRCYIIKASALLLDADDETQPPAPAATLPPPTACPF